jgi:hypothetical protein
MHKTRFEGIVRRLDARILFRDTCYEEKSRTVVRVRADFKVALLSRPERTAYRNLGKESFNHCASKRMHIEISLCEVIQLSASATIL